MATVFEIVAATGEVTCGTVDGVNVQALADDIDDHDHDLDGNVGNTTCDMNVIDGGGSVTNVRCRTAAGASDDFRQAHGEDTHNHPAGTLESNVCTASSSMSPASDDESEVLVASGDWNADKFNTESPEIMHDKYNGHYHSVHNETGDRDLDDVYIEAKASASICYFRTSANNTGTSGVTWEKALAYGGPHRHDASDGSHQLALGAYSYPTGGSASGGGARRFEVNYSNGNVSLDGDANDIGLAQLKADFDAHTGHAVTGTTAEYGQSDAQVFGESGNQYFETSSGVWEKVYLRRLVHTHSGSGLSVDTPS